VDLAAGTRPADAPPRPALPSIGGRIKALAVSDDGRLLAAAMQDGYVRLLDADSGAERARLSGPGDKLASLVFTADGTRLIGGRNDGGIVVWDLASGRQIARLGDDSGRVYALAPSADGSRLVSGAMDGSVRLWALPPATAGQDAAAPAPWRHDGWTWAVALDGTGGLLASAGADGSLVVDRPNGRGEPLRLTGHEGVVPGLVMNRAGTLLASAGADGSVRLWDPADGRALARLGGAGLLLSGGGGGSGLAARITGSSASGGTVPLAGPSVGERWSLALSPDETLLAAGGEDGGILLWDLSGGAEDARLLESLRDRRGRILALAFGGELLASGAEDGSVQLWDVGSRERRARLGGVGGRVLALDLAADGTLLAVAHQDGKVRLWDLSGGDAPLATLDAGGGLTRALRIGPHGRLLATGSEDGRLRLWDIAGGADAAALLASVDTGAGQVVSLAFSGDGRRLAAGTTDGRARTFDLRPISLLANGPAPSARAALIQAALQRLWRLAPDGMDFVDEAWPRLTTPGDPADAPLAPPPAGRGALDALLDRLADQGLARGP
jgi:WD40 repeat protein